MVPAEIHLQVTGFGYGKFIMFHDLPQGIDKVNFHGAGLWTLELYHNLFFSRIGVKGGIDSTIFCK